MLLLHGLWLLFIVYCVRWFLVPCSSRGLAWSRRGRSPRTSGQSWTLSRSSLSSEPDMRETSCWSSEVCTLEFTLFLYTVTCIPPCVHMQHMLSVFFCFSFEVVFFMCSIKVSNSCLPPTPPGRNSAAAVLIAECFPVHLLALCLCLWHIV